MTEYNSNKSIERNGREEKTNNCSQTKIDTKTKATNSKLKSKINRTIEIKTKMTKWQKKEQKRNNVLHILRCR